MHSFYLSVKSVIDKFVAVGFILLLSPLMVVISIVLFVLYGKVLFVQKRPGFQAQPFHMYKFITMRENDSSDIDRITPFGHFLRKLSLDEVPQLFNIIKGEMSFIGPRPFLKEYLPLYSDSHARRHSVMPGITGLAQVTGKNNVVWSEKLDLDAYYVDHLSLGMDLKIIVLTIAYFIKGCPGCYPANKFSGYHS